MADPLVVGAVTFGMAAIAGYGVHVQRSRVRDIGATTPSTTQGLTEGTVALEGTVATSDVEPLTTPVSGTEAVLVDWEVVEEGDEEEPDDSVDGVHAVDFYLEDGHGRVRVHPANPETTVISSENTTTHHKHTTQVDRDLLERMRAFDDDVREEEGFWYQNSEKMAVGAQHLDGDARYVERVIAPGDDVYVLGTATSDGDGTFTIQREGGGRFVLSDLDREALKQRLGSDVKWLVLVVVVLLGVTLYQVALAVGVL